MTRLGFTAAAFASFLIVRSAGRARELHMTVLAALASLREDRHRIVALNVTHIDDLTQTQTPITPASLAESPSAFHHTSHDSATIQEALNLLEHSEPQPTTEAFEVRWKLTFVDASGAALLSVFHHSREGYGYIGSSRVRFANDGILHFLRSRFGIHEKTLDRL
jgi:hypothetical protein